MEMSLILLSIFLVLEIPCANLCGDFGETLEFFSERQLI